MGRAEGQEKTVSRHSHSALSWKNVFLDTNVFIYHFQGHEKFSHSTSRIFENIFSRKWRAHTGVISLLETLSLPAPKSLIEELYQNWLQIPRLKIHQIDLGTSVEAARLRREYGLRTPDALQLATALLSDSQIFITNDRRLRSFPEIPVVRLDEL
jgi:predicted nucleic acid-binding protein